MCPQCFGLFLSLLRRSVFFFFLSFAVDGVVSDARRLVSFSLRFYRGFVLYYMLNIYVYNYFYKDMYVCMYVRIGVSLKFHGMNSSIE